MGALGIILCLFVSLSCVCQSCPTGDGEDAPKPSTLHGVLRKHDELRQWIGLKLDKPVCGKREVQIIFAHDDSSLRYRQADALAGCGVEVTGTLYESPTGYYSASLAVADPEITPAPSCHPKPIEPEPPKVIIPATLRLYEVSITVDYRGKGHADVRVWQDGEQHVALSPWRGYASYWLTGGADLLWLHCADGFDVKKARRTPSDKDAVTIDKRLGTAMSLTERGVNVVTYQCVRPGTTTHK